MEQPGKRGRVDPQVKLLQHSFSSSVAHALTQFGIFLQLPQTIG
jgi:hypothetical protein